MTVREHMALTLGSARYKYEGRRATDARELVDYSETRLWQVVDALLDRPDAMRERPAEVARLRRVRDARRGVRQVATRRAG